MSGFVPYPDLRGCGIKKAAQTDLRGLAWCSTKEKYKKPFSVIGLFSYVKKEQKKQRKDK
ncbi:MAG: hypothetical protein D3906_08680 [Candidatus Electrothrix sp. AUS1_2]|nr:hypothetical protein [Candidatus Electrothrix sp. AUS1_2]